METTAPPTNHQIGEALGIDHTTVSRLRSGQRQPSIGLISKMTKVYQLTPAQVGSLVQDLAGNDKHRAQLAVSKILRRPLPDHG